MADSGADLNGDKAACGVFNDLHDELLEVHAHDAVAMTCVDDDFVREIPEFSPHVRKEGIVDAADTADCHGVDRDENRRGFSASQDERFGETGVIHGHRTVCNVYLCKASEDFCA